MSDGPARSRCNLGCRAMDKTIMMHYDTRICLQGTLHTRILDNYHARAGRDKETGSNASPSQHG